MRDETVKVLEAVQVTPFDPAVDAVRGQYGPGRVDGIEVAGDQRLFARTDWIYEAWAIVDRLVEHWETAGPDGFPNYEAGTRGPRAADELLEREGRAWRVV